MVKPFHQLRWKLIFSYTAVTVAALLFVEVVLIAGLLTYYVQNSSLSPRELFRDLQENYAPVARFYLSEAPPDIAGLTLYLSQFSRNWISTSQPLVSLGNVEIDMTSYDILDVYFINTDGTLIDVVPHLDLDLDKIGQPFDVGSISGLDEPLAAAFRGEQDYRKLYTLRLPEYQMVGALPIFDQATDSDASEDLVGVLAFTTKSLVGELWPLGDMIPWVGYSLLVFALFAGVMGTVFGSITARGLVGRIKQISELAHAWSEGDFGVQLDDSGGDELGSLARDLDYMAQQMENLLAERQAMSIAEERNRLARDLHDSAKQQAFAASAQLGAARTRWSQDPEAAQTHLFEAERLVNKVRQELTFLIQELRPAVLEEPGLASALRDYVFDWSKQNGIEIEIQIDDERPVSFKVEQTLFRIAQEALANVARHSEASIAKVRLTYKRSSIALAVIDDGRGFVHDNGRIGQVGLGLRSMRERIELLNGKFEIESQPGGGTQVLVECLG